MNPPNNTGQFGTATGGISPELQEAIAGRQTQGGVTNQVTQSAPGFDPNTQPSAPPQGAPPPTPMGATPMDSGPMIPSSGENPEVKIILGALKSRLDLWNKVQGAGL